MFRRFGGLEMLDGKDASNIVVRHAISVLRIFSSLSRAASEDK